MLDMDLSPYAPSACSTTNMPPVARRRAHSRVKVWEASGSLQMSRSSTIQLHVNSGLHVICQGVAGMLTSVCVHMNPTKDA